MVILRSLVFNTIFYANLIVQMILWTPYYFLSPRHRAWFVPKFWARTCVWLHEKIAGTKAEITGVENLPAGSFILAPKHQSFWDAIAFFPYLDDPLYILKRELMWIPFFGWYIAKMRMIPVDRGSRSKALKAVMAATKAEMARNDRQLIIYPEGTRRAPGDEPAYKYGIVETLCAARHAGRAGRPCRRPLLAAAQVHALSRHDQGALPEADRAGPRPGGIHDAAGRARRRPPATSC